MATYGARHNPDVGTRWRGVVRFIPGEGDAGRVDPRTSLDDVEKRTCLPLQGLER
jgi:hypothetical protein